MPVLGITGGVGSGKTTFTSLLLDQLPAESFDADVCVRRLLETDRGVRDEVREAFGKQGFDGKGRVDRGQLRSIVFADPAQRKRLEEILHPRVREEWSTRVRTFRTGNPVGWLIVEIPLLFETEAERWFDHVVAVGCSRPVQLERLVHYRKLSPEVAENMIDAQLPLTVKASLADYLIWNESSTACLADQAQMLAAALLKRHG